MTDGSLESAATALLNLGKEQAPVATEAQAELPQEEVEQTEATEETQQEVVEETTEEEVPLLEIEWQGQNKALTKAEAIKLVEEALIGQNRQENYTKKFQEASETKKQAEATLAKANMELNVANELKERLVIVDKFLQTPPVDPKVLNTLLAEGDTEGYLKAKEQLDGWQARKNTISQELYNVNILQDQKQREAFVLHQQNERKALGEKSPELLKEENAGKLIQYLNTSFGITSQEIENIADHRLFLLADKARKWDEIQSKAKDTKTTHTIPKVIKKGAPRTTLDPAAQQKQQAFGALKKTGTVHDAANVLLAMNKGK